MKLLMISPYMPNPSWGASTRSYYLLKALAHEHTVTLLTMVNDDAMEITNTAIREIRLRHVRQVALASPAQTKRAKQILDMLRGRSYLIDLFYREEVQKEIDVLLSQDHYDAVIFESVFMAGYCIPEDVSVIIDQHNIEHELLRRTYQQEQSWPRKWYNWWETRKLKPIELERCRKAQGVLVTSEREYLLLKQLAPQCHIGIVPNGVDIGAFSAKGQQEIVNRIVFTGTMNYYPNIQAVQFFARECWPHIQAQVPGATWHIVGKSPPQEVERLAELPGVTVTGAVPDVKPYLAAASVAIAPLLVGSGTRLKILEALAMQKAIVSTSLGCEGLAVKAGKHLMVEDRPGLFAQAVVDLLRQPEKRASLGHAGRALVEAEYSWERCGNAFNRALEKMVR